MNQRDKNRPYTFIIIDEAEDLPQETALHRGLTRCHGVAHREIIVSEVLELARLLPCGRHAPEFLVPLEL